jgi:hypothetical protein
LCPVAEPETLTGHYDDEACATFEIGAELVLWNLGKHLSLLP